MNNKGKILILIIILIVICIVTTASVLFGYCPLKNVVSWDAVCALFIYKKQRVRAENNGHRA